MRRCQISVLLKSTSRRGVLTARRQECGGRTSAGLFSRNAATHRSTAPLFDANCIVGQDPHQTMAQLDTGQRSFVLAFGACRPTPPHPVRSRRTGSNEHPRHLKRQDVVINAHSAPETAPTRKQPSDGPADIYGSGDPPSHRSPEVHGVRSLRCHRWAAGASRDYACL